MKVICFVVVSWVTSFFSQAQDEIKLMAYDIPAVLQKDKQGKYDLIIEQVRIIQKQQWHYSLAPPPRVDKMFEEKMIDCILPFDKAFYSDPTVINSAPLNIAKARIYSLNNKIMSLISLKNKRVGARKGMLYGPEFDALNLNVSYVGHVNQNIEKLLSERIDAFVAWSPDVEAILLKKGLTLMRSEPFIVHNEAFLCHDSKKTRAFISLFNQGLRQLMSTEQYNSTSYIKGGE
ncbi:hypothetical protein ACOYR1_05055 [Thalassotalea piscium]